MLKENSVALIPGWGVSANAWRPVMPYLAHKRHVLTFDWPWCSPENSLSIRNFDEYTAKLAAELPDSSELIGWSLGGLLGLNIAISHPRKVAKLVLVGSAPCMVSNTNWCFGIDAKQYNNFVERFSAEPKRTWKRFLALVASGDERSGDTRAQLLEGSPYNDAAECEYRYGLECMERIDLRSQLDTLDCEVALIHGANDQLIPCQTSMETQKLIPSASLHIIENAGHAPQIAQPKEFAKELSQSIAL